jgi:hypothetical protein
VHTGRPFRSCRLAEMLAGEIGLCEFVDSRGKNEKPAASYRKKGGNAYERRLSNVGGNNSKPMD